MSFNHHAVDKTVDNKCTFHNKKGRFTSKQVKE